MADCCAESIEVLATSEADNFIQQSAVNTLAFDANLCINCGTCIVVCPHRVFSEGEEVVSIVRADACMECGACQINCPAGALFVDRGVGCAAAMISAASTGKPEASCGGPEPGNCCC